VNQREVEVKSRLIATSTIVIALLMPAAAVSQDVPPPWTATDVGQVGTAGSASFDGLSFSVQASGADIWGSRDAFRFVYQPLTSDATIVARVAAEHASHPLAKAGVMFRHSLDPASAHVILDLKPDGEIEFMSRLGDGDDTLFIAGALRLADAPWLKLVKTGRNVTAYQSADGVSWITISSITMTADSPEFLAGLAVTSHDPRALNASVFDHVLVTAPLSTQNVLRDPGFELDAPPALDHGWVSDAFRESPAKSETHQPRAGARNGACWTPEFLDCGLFQDLLAPSGGLYTLRFYATADRAGGLVGANVNGALAASNAVEPGNFGDYSVYTMSFRASEGDAIRVWMYSPATPGYVVIDDVSLARDYTVTITSGNWTIGPLFIPPPVGRFRLHGDNVDFEGRYNDGIVEAASACALHVCLPGEMVSLRTVFENEMPLTIASFAPGTATVAGVSYVVEFAGKLTLDGGTVTLPEPTPDPQHDPDRVTVSAPFTFSGDLKGFEVLGLRDPKLVFDVPLTGRGTATFELLVGPSSTLTFFSLRYDFEQKPAASR
jgi:hypothetical protein